MNTSDINEHPLYNEILSINERVDAFLLLDAIEQEKGITSLMEDLGKIIHTQFLMDVYDICGEENFQILESSLEKGNEYYEHELSRLVPSHQEIFNLAREKIINPEKFCVLMQKILDMEE